MSSVTRDLFDAAIAEYRFNPGDVTIETFTARLAACETCVMQRSGKCLSGLCCGSVITQAARRDGVKAPWPHCSWVSLAASQPDRDSEAQNEATDSVRDGAERPDVDGKTPVSPAEF